jgi:hypothetical protein
MLGIVLASSWEPPAAEYLLQNDWNGSRTAAAQNRCLKLLHPAGQLTP